jgi:hypothetical protein
MKPLSLKRDASGSAAKRPRVEGVPGPVRVLPGPTGQVLEGLRGAA